MLIAKGKSHEMNLCKEIECRDPETGIMGTKLYLGLLRKVNDAIMEGKWEETWRATALLAVKNIRYMKNVSVS